MSKSPPSPNMQKPTISIVFIDVVNILRTKIPLQMVTFIRRSQILYNPSIIIYFYDTIIMLKLVLYKRRGTFMIWFKFKIRSFSSEYMERNVSVKIICYNVVCGWYWFLRISKGCFTVYKIYIDATSGESASKRCHVPVWHHLRYAPIISSIVYFRPSLEYEWTWHPFPLCFWPVLKWKFRRSFHRWAAPGQNPFRLSLCRFENLNALYFFLRHYVI